MPTPVAIGVCLRLSVLLQLAGKVIVLFHAPFPIGLVIIRLRLIEICLLRRRVVLMLEAHV